VKNDQVVDLTRWFESEPGPEVAPVPGLVPGGHGRTARSTPAGETVTPIVIYWNKKVLDKIGVSQIPQDWTGIMQYVDRPTPRASRRSPSAGSRGGRT
jgi:raffinose/stachyose/melibiose transport system substrate-binding protein